MECTAIGSTVFSPLGQLRTEVRSLQLKAGKITCSRITYRRVRESTGFPFCSTLACCSFDDSVSLDLGGDQEAEDSDITVDDLDLMHETMERTSNAANGSADLEPSTRDTEPTTTTRSQQKQSAAKIHDFCLGIPYGGFLVVGGMFWFILTGSASAIQLGVVMGGLLLALSISSLKVWKQGKSSMSRIQAQAAISFIILAAQLQKFVETKSVLPAIVAFVSGGMLLFYSYVFLSGGNPPPKNTQI